MALGYNTAGSGNRMQRFSLIIFAAAGLAGCADHGRGLPGAPADPPGRWTSLFNGRDLTGWRVAQGSAECRDGAIVLHGDRGDTTIVATVPEATDGEVEVSIRRPPAPEHAGPFTVGLRATRSLAWQAVYFVCRPERVEVCRGSYLRWFPAPEKTARYARADGTERWRFVLAGGRIRCHRNGREVLTYTDPDPRPGTIALTASGCRISVLSVRRAPAPRAGGH